MINFRKVLPPAITSAGNGYVSIERLISLRPFKNPVIHQREPVPELANRTLKFIPTAQDSHFADL
ncbi:hypothetical protein [Methylobacter tundripaludum]|uniref:hypothetical protein n=1 Tax=Methylobacter tundripaludum TaxID=173365 RepID=UPI000314E961|nr:hypothetical protein [Methylobacter tundripaludum]